MKRILLIAIVLTFVAGCARQATRDISTPRLDLEDAGYYADTRGKGLLFDSMGEKAGELNISRRKVASSARVRLETDQPDTVHNRVIDLAGKYEGYVLLSEDYETTIRIPAIHFTAALAEVETLGELKSKQLTGRDVTEAYLDLQVRLDNAEKTRQRYLALLEKANNISEMLRIEAELERINSNIETLKGKLERMAHLVDFSTISVSTAKQVRPGPLGYIFVGIHKGIKWLFVWD
jgi:hypothetical protein